MTNIVITNRLNTVINRNCR